MFQNTPRDRFALALLAAVITLIVLVGLLSPS